MNTAALSHTRILGVVALAGYAVHAAYHLWRGEPQDLLWVCHLASVFIGIGLILPNPMSLGVGTLLICLGTPLWVLDLAQGSEFMPTSLGTHVLGLLIGLYGVWLLGVERGIWWKAAVAMVAMIGISRLVTPRSANVNLAFAMPSGMVRYFAHHIMYLAVMIAISCVYFAFVEMLLRRITKARHLPEAAQ